MHVYDHRHRQSHPSLSLRILYPDEQDVQPPTAVEGQSRRQTLPALVPVKPSLPPTRTR